MRDRVLDSDIIWVAPEEPGDSPLGSSVATTNPAPPRFVARSTVQAPAVEAPPSQTPSVTVAAPAVVLETVSGSSSDEVRAIDPPDVDSLGDELSSPDQDLDAGGWNESGGGLFGGFGVGGDRFDESTFGGEPFESSGPPHHWSIPWSDLMMVMFVLFAVMLTTRANQTPAEPEPPQEAAPQRDRIVRPYGDPMMTINVLERAQLVVKESDAQDVDVVMMEDQSVKVSVRGPTVFELGSVELRPEFMRFLDNLAVAIRTTPYRIEVVGHTDDQPVSSMQFPSNWELSTARASRVVRYLVENGRMAPQRFTVIGHAEYEPLRPNSSEANRLNNRRVEILITRDVLPSSEVDIQ